MWNIFMRSLILSLALFLLSACSESSNIPSYTESKPTVTINHSESISSTWLATIQESNGLIRLTKGGSEALASSLVFWRENWAWSTTQTKLSIQKPFNYKLTGANKKLGLNISGKISKTSPTSITWDISLNAENEITETVGGGIQFKFNLKKFSRELGTPEILPNNTGWQWGKKINEKIELKFEPGLENIYFERGNKHLIRAFFYSKNIPKGDKKFKITLTLPQKFTINPTTKEMFGTLSEQGSLKNIIDWNDFPIDLSFLNANEKPAGKHGFLKAVDEKLIFENGKIAKFWGTNLSASTLFKTPEQDIKQQARRLSKLGFNLVRIHHHDSYWVNPNIFGKKPRKDTLSLDPNSLKQLDLWIKHLKEEGIYIWLDLHVQRQFKKDDEIAGFSELKKKRNKLKGYNYVNKSIQAAMQNFNNALLRHKNQFTEIEYGKDPAIITLLLTNENDVTHHFGNALLPNKKSPFHQKLYREKSDQFAEKWNLPKEKTWRSWVYGPSKIFLNNLEYEFNEVMRSDLQKMGNSTLVATTNSWGNMPVSSLPALTSGDLIDVHSYGKKHELEKNPILSTNMIHWIAASQVINKPLSVSEWNISPFPVPDRHMIPIYIAANAAHQGWDIIIQYAYAQTPLNKLKRPGNWNAWTDPSLLSTFPAAALLFRQGHVNEANSIYVYTPSKSDLFYKKTSPGNSIALRTAAEKGKLLIAMPEVTELPWLEKSEIIKGANTFKNPNHSFINISDSKVTSDNGEISRNWDEGIFTVNTPSTQIASGWLGEKEIFLKDVILKITSKHATVAVQSLTNKPIKDTNNILISLGTHSITKKRNKTVLLQPVSGVISINATEGLKPYKIDKNGSEIPVNFDYKNGIYTIKLDNEMVFWLKLKS